MALPCSSACAIGSAIPHAWHGGAWHHLVLGCPAGAWHGAPRPQIMEPQDILKCKEPQGSSNPTRKSSLQEAASAGQSSAQQPD